MDPTVLKSLKSRTHAEYRFFLYYRTRWHELPFSLYKTRRTDVYGDAGATMTNMRT
jgi:hypothetical protein